MLDDQNIFRITIVYLFIFYGWLFYFLAGYSDFVNCNILSRKPASKEIVYVVADDSGQHTRHILVKGLQAKDPLKDVRHFLALLEPIEGEENHFEAKAILLDTYWVARK